MQLAGRSLGGLLALGATLAASAPCQAGGPQLMFYVTIPVDTRDTHARVFGLRMDRTSSPPGLLVINPASPFSRRALLDLQMGSDAGMRLDIGRRLTWDFGRQQLRPSSKPADLALRLPTEIFHPRARPVP